MPSERAMNASDQDMHSVSSCLWVLRVDVSRIIFLHSEDFANQVRWSSMYKEDIAMHGMVPGKYMSPEAGEFVSGVAEDCCALGLGSYLVVTSSEMSPVNLAVDLQAYRCTGRLWSLGQSTVQLFTASSHT